MKQLISTFYFLLLFFVHSFSQEPICPDAQGSEDFPLISRYEGSCIIGYRVDNFTSYDLPFGPQVERNSKIVASKVKTIEGKLTRLLYGLTNDRSPLEVFRNYESAIKKANFTKLYSCREDECGNQRLFSNRVVYDMAQRLENKGNLSSYALSAPKNLYYSAYSGTQDGITIYLSLLVAKSGSNVGDLIDRTVVLLDVVETTSMENDQILVEDVESSVEANGYARFYGIHFEFNSADLTEDSAYELEVMANFLKDNPAEKVFIVGHTDNVGDHEYNMNLSKQRAESVVNALNQKYDIGIERMQSRGVGELVPVSSNESDMGRKLNRRVELVLNN